MRAFPDRAELLWCLNYDTITGNVTWKARPDIARGSARRLNMIGKSAGRRYVSFNGQRYTTTSLIWIMMTGESPDRLIDHRDVNPDNNAWCNLRLATNAQNTANSAGHTRSTSGAKGVDRRGDKWIARIGHNYDRHYLGRFNTREEAMEAYAEAAQRLCGVFARTTKGDGMNTFEDVREFHLKYGLPVGTVPTTLSKERLVARANFILEEIMEFADAAGLQLTVKDGQSVFVPKPNTDQDLALQADALVDVAYVAIGTAIQMGLPWTALWDDVHAANLRKVPGATQRGYQGDVTKPPGWVGPKTAEILRAYGRKP